jgi:hypothetical protein
VAALVTRAMISVPPMSMPIKSELAPSSAIEVTNPAKLLRTLK